MKFSTIQSVLGLLIASRCVLESDANIPYLKEILTGRCYEQSRSSSPKAPSASSCNQLVGSIMNVLESHLESDKSLTEDLFRKAYVDEADFSSPENKAMVWIEPPVGEPQSVLASAFAHGGKHWTTPETTTGGALLEGLAFCARTVYQDNGGCSPESSNAYWKFWGAAYSSFAESVTGTFELVVEYEHPDENFLREAVLSNLDPAKVTGVRLWGVECESDLATRTLSYLKDTVGIGEAVCAGTDLVELVLCDSDDEACATYRVGKGEAPSPGDTERKSVPAPAASSGASAAASTPADEPIAEDKRKGNGFGAFVVWLLLAIGVYLYYKRHSHSNWWNTNRSRFDRFDCLKGDLVLFHGARNTFNGNGNGYYEDVSQGMSDVSGATGSGSSGTNKYSSFANSYNGGNGNGNGSGSYGASQ